MRTNTWLGLIWLNQLTDSMQSAQINREQRARDESRDQMFEKAHEEATRGQFAMWIQTPDGQLFERWSNHALLASRAIDDRRIAWDLVWEQDLQARRDSARPAAVAEAESRVTEVSLRQVRRAAVQGGVAAVLAATIGMIWLSIVNNLSMSDVEAGAMLSESALMFLIIGLSSAFAIWSFWRAGAAQRRARAVDQYVENYISSHVTLTTQSWHCYKDSRHLLRLVGEIAEVVENASISYPRGEKLIALSGVYETRSELPQSQRAPEAVQRLLAAFQIEDRDRIAALHRDGVA